MKWCLAAANNIWKDFIESYSSYSTLIYNLWICITASMRSLSFILIYFFLNSRGQNLSLAQFSFNQSKCWEFSQTFPAPTSICRVKMCNNLCNSLAAVVVGSDTPDLPGFICIFLSLYLLWASPVEPFSSWWKCEGVALQGIFSTYSNGLWRQVPHGV